MRLLILLTVACTDLAVPSSTLEGIAAYAERLGLPAAGPRPDVFACSVETSSGTLTVSSDGPDVTVFELEGERLRIQSEDAITDIEIGGESVIVFGDVLIVGDEVWRLPVCEQIQEER